MGWANIDDGFHAHPKVVDLLLTEEVDAWAALGVWGLALSWAYRYTIDKPEPQQGLIPFKQVKAWDRMKPGALAAAEALADAKLWDRIGEDFRIHDFREWAHLDLREAKQRGGRKGADRRWHPEPLFDDSPIDTADGSPIDSVNGTPSSEANGRGKRAPNNLHSASTPHPLHSASTSTKTSAADASFERFWAVYPLHKSRAEARKAWTKAIGKTDPEIIIAGAQRYADWCKHHRDISIKYGQGWLTGERWTDEDDRPFSSGEMGTFE